MNMCKLTLNLIILLFVLFKKIVQNVEPVTDANREPASIREPDSGESPLSLSAEFSRSAEYGRSGEFTPSESPLLHSYDGAREGISASPKTAFLNLRNRYAT